MQFGSTAPDQKLLKLTGLKPEFATACVKENGGSFHSALASFIQSYAVLPDSYFTDRTIPGKSLGQINTELSTTYGAVQLVVELAKVDEPAAWAALQKTKEWNAASAISALTGKPAPAAAVSKPFPIEKGTTTPAVTSISAARAAPIAAKTAPVPPPSVDAPVAPTNAFGAKSSTALAATAPTTAFGAKSSTAPTTLFGSKSVAAAPAAPSAFGAKTATAASPTPFGAKTAAPAAPTAFEAPTAAAPAAPTAFGAKTSSAPTAATGAFGATAPKTAGVVFGTKAVTSAPAAAGAKAPAAVLAFGKKPVEAAPSDEPKVAQLRVEDLPPLPADRYTGCLWDLPNFWKDEVEAKCTLLVKDCGFLKATGKDNLRKRLLRWVEISKLYSAPLKYVGYPNADEEIVRVIIKDAHRTFFNDTHRQQLVEFLWSARVEFGDYAQSMSYIAALCLLVLTEQETISILRKISKEYIPKHWAAEAVGFATNAYLIDSIFKSQQPEIHKHFDKLNFWPEIYMQKIISGLCVHVLNFDQLFDFLDAFMEGGFAWLVRYELAIVEHFRTQLLACDSSQMNTLLEIMKLDTRVAEPEDAASIYNRAKRMNLGDALNNIDIHRMTIYNEKVAPRLAKVPKEEAFEPCAICETNKIKWWCNTCELAICDKCHKEEAKSHNAACKVEKY